VTWIVTGGISGFGLESAHWLAQCGVGHLALVSRSGLNTPNAQEIIDAFKVQGIHARIFSCDLRDANAVVKLIDEIQQNMPP
jgi:NAD(P)-dependent dehydrogenase (short-subunit alcohol dehydrogenase family)